VRLEVRQFAGGGGWSGGGTGGGSPECAGPSQRAGAPLKLESCTTGEHDGAPGRLTWPDLAGQVQHVSHARGGEAAAAAWQGNPSERRQSVRSKHFQPPPSQIAVWVAALDPKLH
jgi:hypothetical protein